MKYAIASEYALTGKESLKVTISVNAAGSFKSYLLREGGFTGGGATIYVLAPVLPDVVIDYIQLCIPSYGWACSEGTDIVQGEWTPITIVQGEWTPITIDLEQVDKNGRALSEQLLKEIAVQWKFSTTTKTSFDLYFDSVEIFHSGR